ncbi:hypothetical protein J8F10_24230 [Gemmata sp. G18]|uniref:Uncharacterized protein n=1 Tax=Gemmata palustris TaxID=2822762 RepID=A0ABS5BXD9_9BACT|nr:hypothetical protein [Gemmata palustris]MBP3958369.1 hypothetical protein [Gemmata palustris]
MIDIARKIDEAAKKLATGPTVTSKDTDRAFRVVFAEEMEKMWDAIRKLQERQHQQQTRGWDE